MNIKGPPTNTTGIDHRSSYRLLAIIACALIVGSPSYALEPGFYRFVKPATNLELKSIFERTADLKVMYTDSVVPEGWVAFDEMLKLPRNSSAGSIALVWLETTRSHKSETSPNVYVRSFAHKVKRVELVARKIGCKRLVIVAPSFSAGLIGVYLLADKEYIRRSR